MKGTKILKYSSIIVFGILGILLLYFFLYHALLFIFDSNARDSGAFHWTYCQHSEDFDKIGTFMIETGQNHLDQLTAKERLIQGNRSLVLIVDNDNCFLYLRSINPKISDIDLTYYLSDEIIDSTIKAGFSEAKINLQLLVYKDDIETPPPYVVFEGISSKAKLIYKPYNEKQYNNFSFSIYEWRTISIDKDWYLCYELNKLNHY